MADNVGITQWQARLGILCLMWLKLLILLCIAEYTLNITVVE